MNEQCFIGCDPGNLGAICLLRIFPNKLPKAYFIDGSATRRELMSWLNKAKKLNIIMAMLEDVSTVPGSGATANFQFGRNVERMHFALELQPYGLDLVRALVWQKAVGVKRPKKKKTTVTKKKVGSNRLIKLQVEKLCNQLYPKCDIYGSRGGLKDGRSDALMIAHYCRLKYTKML